MARGIAETVAKTGITVNSILPGPTRDPSDPRFADFAKRMGKATMEEAEAEFINTPPAHVAHQALRAPGRSGLADRLRGEPAVVGHHRLGAARGWWRGQERVLRAKGTRSSIARMSSLPTGLLR